MVKNKICMLALLALLGLSACSGDDEPPFVPFLEIEEECVDFLSEDGEQVLEVKTNVEECTARADQPWCHPSLQGGQLHIQVDESQERLVRSAVVTVKANVLEHVIAVRQLGYEAAVLVDKENLTAEAAGSVVELNVTANVPVKAELPDWIVEQQLPASRAVPVVTTPHRFTVKAYVDGSQPRTATVTFREVLPEGESQEETPVPASASFSVTQQAAAGYQPAGLDDMKDDVKLKVVRASASSYQPGDEIEKSFDGDFNTIYHSKWDNSTTGYFPVTLTYYLENASDVDYLVYYPRQDSPNGRFKEVEIYYSEDGNSFIKLTDKDFAGNTGACQVVFDKRVKASAFRFVVKSGAGSGIGFASCAEMEFYQKNIHSFDYTTLFSDPSCSELKEGVGAEEIARCEYPFFKNIAYYMLRGEYEREFRIDEFKAYPNPLIQSTEYCTAPYSFLDNPTGICVEKGDELVVMVGDTRGLDISLVVQNLDCPGGDGGAGGEGYPLSTGVNKLAMRDKGLVYVNYQTSRLDDDAAPVRIHFATGTVNGYYDAQRHKGRWTELLGKASFKYFDVVGTYAALAFETDGYRTYTGDRGEELIAFYDNLVYHEQLLLGLFKYRGPFRNRMRFSVIYDRNYYMYAANHYTAYVYTTMKEILSLDNLLDGGSAWGPAHEVGHINQTRPGLHWYGLGEVTNNIMSEYIQTEMLGNASRVQTEKMLPWYGNRYTKAWYCLMVKEQPFSRFTDLGGETNDPFCSLIPFWQLQLYFGQALGQDPRQTADKDGFYPRVYEYARSTDYSRMSDGEMQLDFIYNCCQASHCNLLRFFERWGFMRPVQSSHVSVSEAQVAQLRSRVEALDYPEPDVVLEYISDNTVECFRTKAPVVAGGAATLRTTTFIDNGNSYTGTSVTTYGWQNVVAYEVKDAVGRYIHIYSGETEPSSLHTIQLPVAWEEGFRIYAVSAAGERTEVPVAE